MFTSCSWFWLFLFIVFPPLSFYATSEKDTDLLVPSRLVHLFNVRYLKCVEWQQIYSPTMLVLPLNQSLLTLPGPLACALSCKANERKDHTYTYAIMHVSAKGKFANQLVCGCGLKNILDGTSGMPDDHCEMPCPQGANATVDAVHRGREKKKKQRRDVDQSLQQIRLNLPRGSGSGTSSNSKGAHRANRQTCGNGLGLLSAYEILRNSAQARVIDIDSVITLSSVILSLCTLLSLQ